MTEKEKDLAADAPGEKRFLLGNEAIARGALEAGVAVAASYPGTPSSEILRALSEVALSVGMYVEWSTNEKVAFETALAASLCGVRAMASMKHVGVNVALDSVMTASYMGAVGGLVLISADDPSAWSSQSEQDNRYIAQQAYLPVLEPSSVQEAKDMMADAFGLSEEFEQPFILRPVTRVAHGRGDVELGTLQREKRVGRFEKDASRFVLNPASVRKNRPLLIERLRKIQKAFNDLRYNELRLLDKASLGIIASGVSYSYTMEAVRWLGIEDHVSILKIGTPYPLPSALVLKLLSASKTLLVVEELEPIIETKVKALAQEMGSSCRIHGKDLVPLAGELTVDKVAEVVATLKKKAPPPIIQFSRERQKEVLPLLPTRPPTLCAGCPHRASFYEINVASKRVSREMGEDIVPIYPGDIGCYGLGFQPPLKSKDISISMGGSFGLANGLARVMKVPIIAHMGDSTFFHSGISPMINLVYNKANVTMVILDNSTTSMTGFQPHPGSGETAMGDVTLKIRPENVARACGIEFVEVADPFETEKSIDILERAIRYEGPSFVVLQRTCAVLEQREKKSRGETPTPFRVDEKQCLVNKPPCQSACPLQIDVRGYVAMIREGRFDEASDLVREKLPFPGILGRVCTRPCETKCMRGDVDEPIAIAALHRSAADHGRRPGPDMVAEDRDEKVAVIGGGPAGMMAAYDLRKLGYHVTIFDALPMLGGMLAVGVPEYRLPRDILLEETSILGKMGVDIRLNTRIGADISLSDLRSQHSAVFIATGAHRGPELSIEDEGARGVVDGIEFLRKVNLGEKVESHERATVIGGGMVAVDCARTCLRLGFKHVDMLYRRSRDEMPGIQEEVRQAETEGVKIHFLVTPCRVLTQDGRATALECAMTELGEPDAGGRKRPVKVEGSEFLFETDLIISAVGGEPDLNFLREDGGAFSGMGRLLEVDLGTMETGVPGIFGGGDVVTGPSTVVQALAAGRRAARSIDRYIRGVPLEEPGSGEETNAGRPSMVLDGEEKKKRVGMETLEPERRHGNFHEIEFGFSKKAAMEEAARCLSCVCKTCINLLGCPAIIMDQGEVVIDRVKCPGCGVCAQVCPNQAILPGVKDGDA